MAESSYSQQTIDQITQNANNRKFVYQNIVTLLKGEMSQANAQELFNNQNILDILENFYSARFIVLCNETFSFLYQVCKTGIKTRSNALKTHILSLSPRLLVVYLYYTTSPAEKDADIDGLEILLSEMMKLDTEEKDKTDVNGEIMTILDIFPDFNNILLNATPNVYSKKLKSMVNITNQEQENKIAKIIEIFVSYLHFYKENTLENFFLLSDMIAGIKINLKELHLSNAADYTKDFGFVGDNATKSKIMMECMSGLEAVKALKPKYESRATKCINNLSLKSVNSGQFLAYVYGETLHFSKLDDVFS